MKYILNKVLPVFAVILSLAAYAIDLNLGGDGTSEKQKMVYYLIGSDDTYPNLRLSLWSEIEDFNKTAFGTLRLNGDLELRVNDWFDNDEEGVPFDNRLIEMGWMFKEQQE